MIPLTTTGQSADSLSNESRIEYILLDTWIGYSRAREILQTMEELRHHPRICRMPSMLLVAPTNNGKTVLLQKFFDTHRPLFTRDAEKVIIPVVYVHAPPVPSEKMLYINILEALNTPYNGRGTAGQLYLQVLRILRKADTKVLIIDEIHHILAGSMNNRQGFLNGVKNISNETRVVIIGAGIKDAFNAISTDKQLENRFEPAILPTWKLDTEYFRLLTSYEAILPLRKVSNLVHEQIAIKILSMAGGTIGEISRIIKKAAILAITSGKEHIDLSILNKIKYVPPADRQLQYQRQML